MDLHAKTLTELAAGLDKGEYSSVELTRSLLDRIAAHDETLNLLTLSEGVADGYFVTTPTLRALNHGLRHSKERTRRSGSGVTEI